MSTVQVILDESGLQKETEEQFLALKEIKMLLKFRRKNLKNCRKMRNLYANFVRKKVEYKAILHNLNEQIVAENEVLNQIKNEISYSMEYLNR